MKTELSNHGRLTIVKAKNQKELHNYLIPLAYSQSDYKQTVVTFIGTDISCDDFLKQLSEFQGFKFDKTELQEAKIRGGDRVPLYSSRFIGNSIFLDFPDKSLLRDIKQEFDMPLLKTLIPYLEIKYRTSMLIIENIDNLIDKENENLDKAKENLLHQLYYFSRKYNIQIVIGDLAIALKAYEEEITDVILFTDKYNVLTTSRNSEFEFTPENIAKLQELNDKIRLEEIRMKNFLLKNERLFNKWIKNNLIDDYNMFDTRLSLWSYNEEFNKKHRTELGDPFFASTSAISIAHDNQEFFDTNWNEFSWDPSDHPLNSMYVCYTMHCIIFHSGVCLEDLLKVDDVWMEFNVDFQFWTDKVKGK